MALSSESQKDSPQVEQAVSPVDILRGSKFRGMSPPTELATTSEARPSSDSTDSSGKAPRTARFAEATSVHSPVSAERARSPFDDPPQHQESRHTVSDIGFEYFTTNEAGGFRTPASPLKSALKTPGTPGRTLNPLSPTFREEYILEKQEKATEKENAKDLRVKARVRIVKFLLRFVNFGCSLIVLSLLATTLTIFNATRTLPPRNNLPAWATGTNPWAQYLLLGLASFSLFTCMIVFWGYWKGGHKRAQKVAVYYSVFAVCYFVFSLLMWVVGAVIYENSKATGKGKDLWGWTCKKKRKRTVIFRRDRLRPSVPSSGLGAGLCRHRSGNRSLRYYDLHRCLLSLLLETQAYQINVSPRPRPVGSLPGPTSTSICSKHSRVPSHPQVSLCNHHRIATGHLFCCREWRNLSHAICLAALTHASSPRLQASSTAHPHPTSYSQCPTRRVRDRSSSCCCWAADSVISASDSNSNHQRSHGRRSWREDVRSRPDPGCLRQPINQS